MLPKLTKVLAILICSLLVTTLVLPAAAQQQPTQEKKDPLVVSILKLILPLGQTLLDKIFSHGGKKSREQVKAELDAITTKLTEKKAEVDVFVDTLAYWQQLRVSLPLVRGYTLYIDEDTTIVASNRDVADTVWPILQANLAGLMRFLPKDPPPQLTQFETAHQNESINLDDYVRKLNEQAGELDKQMKIAEARQDKGELIANMKQISAKLVELSGAMDSQLNRIAEVAVAEYRGLSKAIGAMDKTELTFLPDKRTLPKSGQAVSSPFDAWAQEVPPPQRGQISIQEADNLLKQISERRDADRARILSAVRDTGPEHGLPVYILPGLGGAVLGIGGKELGAIIARKISGGTPRAASA